MYNKGRGVDKDEQKGIYHLEVAAIGGHPEARYHLAIQEGRNRKIDRSVKHLIIAANLGHDKSIQKLMVAYKAGCVDKKEFAAALRSHHAAVVESMKSPQREAARRYTQS
jgi:TPR repeat protein